MGAEERHYCTVSAGGFARVDTAVAVDNAGIRRGQVVGSSSPRETDNTRINRVSSRTREMMSVDLRVGPEKLQGGQLIRDVAITRLFHRCTCILPIYNIG